MKRKAASIFIPLVALVMVFAGYTTALATHTGGDVDLRDANGALVTNGTTPYSPKMSCGASTSTCHGGTTSGTLGTVTDSNGNPLINPSTGAGIHSYGYGTAFSTHVQGVLDSTGTIYWQADQVTSYADGASVGYHMNQGRNENYTNVSRLAYGDPFFTSSPGMFGKY